jgi:superfamily II DNA/RNA helicase
LYYMLLDPTHEPVFSMSAPDRDSAFTGLSGQQCRRVLVFTSTVDSCRRLAGLLRALRVPVWSLHGDQQQKQRMNAVERFKRDVSANPSGGPARTLVATDVAARGLDIPAIDMVIHYDVAPTPDLYIHRSGRTARAGLSGTTVTLVAAAEKMRFKGMLNALAKAEAEAAEAHGMSNYRSRSVRLSEPPLARVLLRGQSVVCRRVVAARLVDREENALRRHDADAAWFRKTAQEAELDFSDGEEDGEVGVPAVPVKMLKGRQRQRAEDMAASMNEDDIQIYNKKQAALLSRRKMELEALLDEKIPPLASVSQARIAAASNLLGAGSAQGKNIHAVASMTIREKGFSKRRAQRELAKDMARRDQVSSTRGSGQRGGRGGGRGGNKRRRR